MDVITSMVFSSASRLVIRMMDIEKQSNGSDCGVLAIAYAYDICSGLNPCQVRFDHTMIRQHLELCLENAFLYWVSEIAFLLSPLKPWTFIVHADCLMSEGIEWLSVIHAILGITATAWTFPVKCLVAQMYFGNASVVVTEIAILYRYTILSGLVSLPWPW